jgi:hypothetical protein
VKRKEPDQRSLNAGLCPALFQVGLVCYGSLRTTERQRLNSSINASACSSDDRGPLPPKPADDVPLPYPVDTAMNFINSSASSSGLLELGFDSAGAVSSAISINDSFLALKL